MGSDEVLPVSLDDSTLSPGNSEPLEKRVSQSNQVSIHGPLVGRSSTDLLLQAG